ncbi:mechanosensitive ion channel family protein [Halorubrum tibetense]|uniref:Mechanosensitive ion channel family protein n=1 Tax=Halorubrum tibetense TaxID=175631 RepID=A0ABD5S8S2_9EURY
MTPLEATTPIAEWSSWLAGVPGVRFFIVVLSVVAGAVLARFVVRVIGRPVAKQFSRQSVAQTVVRGVRVGTITLAFLFGLWAVGFQFTDLLIGTAVLSAVVGIILAPLVGNFINGLFILADQPFEIGDMIELDDGTQGFIEDITIRYTKIFTLDNTFLVIPNGNMRDRDVTNYSAEDERTRRSTDVLVTYESDIDEGRRRIERAARDCESIINGGPDIRVGVARYNASPECRIQEFGDNGILLRLRYWVKKPYKLAKVQSELNTRIRDRLSDADVEMAYPHRHLVFDDTSGVAQVGLREDQPRDGVDAAGTGETPSGEQEVTTAGETGTAVGVDGRGEPDSDTRETPEPDRDTDGSLEPDVNRTTESSGTDDSVDRPP